VRRLTWGLACMVIALAAAGCSSGGSSSGAAVRLEAGPAAAAAVAPVHVSVSGLPATGTVTVQARTTDYQGRPWESSAVFRTSATGTLDLATAVPVSGSYHTADAAGLLWSLHAAFTTSPDTPFVASLTGFTVRLDVLTSGHVVASATLLRRSPAGHEPVLPRRRALLLRHAPVLPALHRRRRWRHRAGQRPGHRAVLDPDDQLPQSGASPINGPRNSRLSGPLHQADRRLAW
jgi:hypothetical protein